MALVFHVLSIEDGVDPDFFPKERFRAALGVVLYAIAGVAGWLSTPFFRHFSGIADLCGITSEGLT
jgi:TMEM175 potassium channel family protein